MHGTKVPPKFKELINSKILNMNGPWFPAHGQPFRPQRPADASALMSDLGP
jgi:hypothetical protein